MASAAPIDRDLATLARVVAELHAELGVRPRGPVSRDSQLDKDLGFGSLERVELMLRIEEAFGARLPEAAFANARTIADLLEIVAGAGASPRSAATFTPAPSGGERETPGPRPSRAQAGPNPDGARTLVEVLLARVSTDRDRPCIHLPDDAGNERVIAYGDLDRGARRVAAGLRDLALPVGARVALMLPTGEDFFLAFIGTLYAGLVPVPIYPPFRADRVGEYIERESALLRNAEASALIVFPEVAAVAGLARDRVPSLARVTTVAELMAHDAFASPDAVAQVGPEALALIQYTSGSTGDPKGVALTHANLLANMRACGKGVAFTPADVAVSWLPLYHDMGLIGSWLTTMYFACPTTILSPVAFLSRPERWLWTMHAKRATASVAPNFAFDLCARRIRDEAIEGLDLSSVRFVMNGAEPVRPETVERFCERFGRYGFKRGAMFPVYGLAENAVGLTFPPLGRGPRYDWIDRATLEREGRAAPVAALASGAVRHVSCGSPLEGCEVRIVAADGTGAELPERAQGRLLFRSPSSTAGYFRRPDRTAELIRPDGWLDSGDLGYRVEGEVYITGRVKDLIIRGGRNIHPRDIEQAAEGVEGVRRGCVAAFGVPDEKTGTDSVCVVAEVKPEILGGGGDGEAARARVADAISAAVLEATGTPADRVVLVPPGSVPKTSSGKIMRRDTRARVLAGEIGRKRPPTAVQVAGLALGSVPARLRSVAAKLGRVLFGIWSYVSFLALALVFLPLVTIPPAGRLPRRAAFLAARIWMRIAGLWPTVRGRQRLPRGPVVFVANHTSYLDVFLLAAALPPDSRYVAKMELLNAPLIGRVLSRGGHVGVERDRPDRAVEAFREVKRILEAGEPVVFFPEATFTRAAGLRPFRLGAFRLAAEVGVPVVPVALLGSRRVLPAGVWMPRPWPVVIDIGDPIWPDRNAAAGLGAYVKLRDAAADSIAARIDEPRLDLVAAGPAPSKSELG